MQDTKTMSKKIIVFGGDHHNGLGLARILGKNGFDVISIVVSDYKKSWLKHSNYVAESHVFHNYKSALDYILNNYNSKSNKHIVIPYSDGAALEVDNRLDEIKDFFIVPSIDGVSGKIAYFMNKQNQYDFAVSHGIKIAKSFTLNLNEPPVFDSMLFPCILKPVISAEGDKSDIKICDNSREFLIALDNLKQKKYKRIFVQEFISFEYEIDVFGCICNNYPYESIVPTKTIRSYPPKRGTNSYSEVLSDDVVIKKCKKVVDALKNIGFYGLYDIELFVKDGDIWLNEINFRNSGDVYMVLKQNVLYPLIWVNDALEHSCNKGFAYPQKKSFAMTELADVRNVFNGRVSVLKWLNDFVRTDDYAVLSIDDPKPLFFKLLIGAFNRIFK